MTQMAATKRLFQSKRMNPCAVVFVVDQKRNHITYHLEFDEEMQREWDTLVLPKAVKFYISHMLPRFLTQLNLPRLAEAANTRTMQRRVDVAELEELDDSVDMDAIQVFSPVIRKGKIVRRKKGKGDVYGTVEEILGGGLAKVKWHDSDKTKMRPSKLDSLEVAIIHPDEVIRPDRKGQKVKIIGGPREELHGKTGTVESFTADLCTIILDEGGSGADDRRKLISLNNVHALEPPRVVTVPPSTTKTYVLLKDLPFQRRLCRFPNTNLFLNTFNVCFNA